MEAMHNSIAGNWHHDVDKKVVDYGLSIGDIYMTTGYLLWIGYMKIEKGEFQKVNEILEILQDITNEFEHEQTKADFNYLNARLFLKINQPNKALPFADKGILQTGQTRWEGRKIQSLGIKTRLFILLSKYEGARKSIEQADELLNNAGQDAILPFCYIDHLIGKLSFKLISYEQKTSKNEMNYIPSDKKEISTIVKNLKNVSEVAAFEKVEVLRLIGLYHWLNNRKPKAIKWWNKSVDEGKSLGAKLETAKTYLEMGKRLLSQNDEENESDKLEGAIYLKKAKTSFEELKLKKFLRGLEKIY
jgi:tetratricopeptide (TPR) repeat protein